MFEVGRLAVKIAGRDAGKKCVVIEELKDNRVLIDGETRRKKCNPKHLEPLGSIIKISKSISHEDLKKELKKLDIEIRETKPKETTERPKKQKKKSSSEETKPSEKSKKPITKKPKK
ncbi:MAG: KOW domain-containing RNA-binding protein [Candidatus Woesearchaeota archaeon]|jgi:large subunit ribosomal protein L14e|nr:KOW domain-containing RNA-binding protein [Candidatus Woesearchaeota archaeon]MDP7323740.1 KOW domain-containing RNA-binding protein [Candidatus Woesearchaeota archaeon]MDP7457526.1 KOW domain-containing RNA-binding protein [Candidatus Woesearchaeota archaeon]|tara:strand:- start:384 stop:734 length:351 start_codon:yes stop_codon:yes gene_type:complete